MEVGRYCESTALQDSDQVEELRDLACCLAGAKPVT